MPIFFKSVGTKKYVIQTKVVTKFCNEEWNEIVLSSGNIQLVILAISLAKNNHLMS